MFHRDKRAELEGQLEKRRADQEAQKIQVVEDTERLREARAAALQEMKALQSKHARFLAFCCFRARHSEGLQSCAVSGNRGCVVQGARGRAAGNEGAARWAQRDF